MKIFIFYGITIAMVKINILQYLHISATYQESFLTAVVASDEVDDAQRDSWEVESKYVQNTRQALAYWTCICTMIPLY
jgi:hypothetical protein